MSRKRVIDIYAGARPNAPKIWTLLAGLRRYAEHRLGPDVGWRVAHTNQHHHGRLGAGFCEDIGIRIDANLGVGPTASDGDQLATLIRRIEADVHESRPSAILVVGDVNTTLAAAIVGARNGYPVIHAEAGLRSASMTPEEVNRRLITPCSTFHLAPSERAVRNLHGTGIAPENVFYIGNLMAECFLRHESERRESTILDRLGLVRHGYVVVTVHKTRMLADLQPAIAALKRIGERIVFPCHPHTERALHDDVVRSWLVPPQRYADFGALIEGSRFVVTDSDGVQEECAVAGVGCLTLAADTARPETIECGSNRLIDPGDAIELGERRPGSRPPRWDSEVSRRWSDALATIVPQLPVRGGRPLRAEPASADQHRGLVETGPHLVAHPRVRLTETVP